MTACPLCMREMLASVSCNRDPFIIGGEVFEPLPWSNERRFGRARQLRVPRLWNTPGRNPPPRV
jgi:hypothetical protein